MGGKELASHITLRMTWHIIFEKLWLS